MRRACENDVARQQRQNRPQLGDQTRNTEDHVGSAAGLHDLAAEFLPRVVARLIESTPGLTYEVVDGTYEDLTVMVGEGALDAVVAGFPPIHRAEDLEHEELVPNEFVLVCGASHPLAKKPHTTLDAVARQKWLLANRPRAIMDLAELQFRLAGIDPPRILVQSGSMIFLKSVVLEGRFVTFLPRGSVADDIATGRLIVITVAGTLPAKTVEGIIYRTDAVHPPSLRQLITAIRDEQRRIEERE